MVGATGIGTGCSTAFAPMNSLFISKVKEMGAGKIGLLLTFELDTNMVLLRLAAEVVSMPLIDLTKESSKLAGELAGIDSNIEICSK